MVEITVIAAYNVYNNAATIHESLLSVLPYVEKVIAIDGAYIRFPHKLKSGASTDATKKIFHELCGSKLTWIAQKKPMSQVAKKNKLLRSIPVGKWFFRLAGDEVVTGNIRKAFRFAESSKYTNIGVLLRNHLPIWDGYEVCKLDGHAYVDLFNPIPNDKWDTLEWKPHLGFANRIVRKQRGMLFKGHHSTMYKGREPRRIQTRITDILIINQPQKTGCERWHRKIEYKKRRYEEGDYEG